MTVLRVAGAQLPNVVGDVKGNAKRIRVAMDWASGEGADVLVLPELVLTGYPVDDLVQQQEFVAEAEEALAGLAAHAGDTVTVLSTIVSVPPRRSWDSLDRSVSISAALLSSGEHRGTYHKVLLPTYGGFDEGKNFAPGRRPDALWRIGDVIAGVCICEDLWSNDGPPEAQSSGGAQILLSPNASLYHRGKAAGRRRLSETVARRNGVPLVYVNLVGGHDEIVFDGGSLVVGGDGRLLHRAAEFAEDRFVVDVPVAEPRRVVGPVTNVHTRPVARRHPSRPPAPARQLDEPEQIWRALVMGTRDFAVKNHFASAVLGLSGGIDAALTAAVAADALGPEHVLGVAMPGPNTPAEDQVDAEKLAANLGIGFTVVPVTGGMRAVSDTMDAHVPQSPRHGAVDRLAARVRASMLETLAEEHGRLLLATGNKTELSIGDPALLGNVGEFAPLKDCPKTLLYTLARHRNRAGEVIPERVLTKETSAQRANGLPAPSYWLLDSIVERYIEFGYGLEDLIAAGFDPDQTLRILHLVEDAELTRRRIPPGVKITPRAYGTDRRMPISNAWRAYRRPDVTPSLPGEDPLRLPPETVPPELVLVKQANGTAGPT